MKKTGFLLLATLFNIALFAQPKPTELDKSPMDMSYWPANYPILKMSGKARDLPIARVIYGRPAKTGRSIFGGIVKYNELWRLGANEATELELFNNVKMAGKLLPKGRYTLFCIPSETKWTIIVSKDNFCWGSFTYDAKKDIARAETKPEKNTEMVENFTIYFEDNNKTANLIFEWDDLKASIPFTLADNTNNIAKKK